MSEWINDEEWETVVQNVPIVSVDLVVECPEGIVLGRRSNEPAKGEWFVPGGRVRKGERLQQAVQRVGEQEISADVTVQERLGVFEHFYETSEIGSKKHYVAHGYHVWTQKSIFNSDDQHSEIAVFGEVPHGLHEYVEQYLEACEFSDST